MPEFRVTELETLFWHRLGRYWHTRLVGGRRGTAVSAR